MNNIEEYEQNIERIEMDQDIELKDEVKDEVKDENSFSKINNIASLIKSKEYNKALQYFIDDPTLLSLMIPNILGVYEPFQGDQLKLKPDNGMRRCYGNLKLPGKGSPQDEEYRRTIYSIVENKVRAVDLIPEDINNYAVWAYYSPINAKFVMGFEVGYTAFDVKGKERPLKEFKCTWKFEPSKHDHFVYFLF